ncbi:nicotinamide N-methyltransferase-like [Paramormyrops kingsleyae]|uniref:Zgc:64002 n=1 Tax=Paramormyrops kingsleyae TaxID=1676925 RepID=A0A3B3R9N3_9TELE|nr:nicotinamide N-methyltransferase-like [Paramormyrops kingsleyae]
MQMAAMEGSGQTTFTEGESYQDHFDPRAYLNSFYSCPHGNSDENCLKYELRQLSKSFGAGKYKGRRLIEIGSGPSIHGLISACEHFEEIIMSDFADCNRQEIERWLRADADCFDWDPVIQFVCEVEGNRRTPGEKKVRLKQTVKQVLKCDVRLENPFGPLVVGPADCLLSCLCLEAACRDLETYQRVLGNLKMLLKPGAVLVMVGVLNETFYMVGGKRFSCLALRESFIQETLKNLGFSVEEFNVMPLRSNNMVSDFTGIFHVVARNCF